MKPARQDPRAKLASPDHLEQPAHLGRRARLELEASWVPLGRKAKLERLGLRAKPALRGLRGRQARLGHLGLRAKLAPPARWALKGRQGIWVLLDQPAPPDWLERKGRWARLVLKARQDPPERKARLEPAPVSGSSAIPVRRRADQARSWPAHIARAALPCASMGRPAQAAMAERRR